MSGLEARLVEIVRADPGLMHVLTIVRDQGPAGLAHLLGSGLPERLERPDRATGGLRRARL